MMEIIKHTRCQIALSLLALVLCASVSAKAEQLGPAVKQGAFREALADGAVVPRWIQGALVSFIHSVSSGSQPNVTAYDKQGRVLTQATVWFPDAFRVKIDDVTRGVDGRLAVAGVGVNRNGVISHFIAFLEASGQTSRVIQTNPFMPEEICLSTDGNLWAFGYDMTLSGSRSNDADSPMLKVYDPNGVPLKTVLKQSNFKNGAIAATNRGGGRRSHLTSIGSDVFLFSGTAQDVLRFNNQAEQVGRWHFEWPLGTFDGQKADKQLNGLAFTSPDKIYAAFSDGNERSLAHLDLNSGRWTPLDNTVTKHGSTGGAAILLGADNDNLVYLSTDLQSSLSWAKPQR